MFLGDARLRIQFPPKTSKELTEQTGAALNNVSNYLATLLELGLVKCLKDELRKGRMYALTNKGKEIYGALISNEPVVVSRYSEFELRILPIRTLVS
jgi:DNA-binding MarR family transcriptional regulator